MDILSSSSKQIHESNVELYRSRLAGRLCIAIVCLIQTLARILVPFVSPMGRLATILLLISTIFDLIMIAVITAEYIFFKKFGPRFAKYATIVDIILLLLFIGDWVAVLVSTFNQIEHTDPPTFQITAIYGFTSFSWRALLVTLIIQNWKLKILPPLVACIMSSVWLTIYNPKLGPINLFRAGCQLTEIFLAIYCENRIKWRMIWTNLHRERWVQVNNFILNNIPENIIILSFKGNPKFISDHCKVFMEKSGISHHKAQDLFTKIRDLQVLPCEPEVQNSPVAAGQIERLTTQYELLQTEKSESQPSPQKIESLEDLIVNFKGTVKEKNLQERQFLIYNGKFKDEENDLKEKSIEVKISFVNHVEKEYIILILRDTTQRDLLVALQETNKYKDQLLASVSHELRAPLNGNINLVEAAISSSNTPENIKEALLIPALRSSKFLLHIINDILDMSQIKQKKLRLDFQSQNLKETLNNAAQLIELQAQKKGVKLQLELDPNLPTKFCTDHMRLNQIILNLLSNALKFTNEGFVKLIAKPMTEEENWIKITVEDSGIGICQKHLHKLFSSYSTIELDGRQSINSTGVGLGLNLASNLADLLAPKEHPGISVNSVPGQGSIFSFILENKQIIPINLPQEFSLNISADDIADELPEYKKLPDIQRNPDSTSRIMPLTSRAIELETLEDLQCSCPKVLIVDDNPFNIMAFETILNSLNIQCDSVYSGSACIKKLLCRQNKTCRRCSGAYSVVFMDQEMPQMTGSETVMEIRRLQRENSIPETKIIGCTAHKAREEVENFMESGLDSCIFKPISVVMIRDILKEILLSE